MYKSVYDRFFEKVIVRRSDDCWEWLASLNTNGYGGMWVKDKIVLAHRLSWELHIGPIPIGMLVLHKCDNKKCVNPNHLYIGTQADNMGDTIGRGRGMFGAPKVYKDTSLNALVHVMAKIELRKSV